MSDVRYHALPDGRRIAFRFTPGASPALVFLPGYKSDMAGGKATAVLDRAVADGQACLLLDYSGCGLSDGDFADGTLSRWREEVVALVEAYCPGEVVLIGSSMGGWLMLLAAQLLPQVRAMIGIAAAPDFTSWGYDAEQKRELSAGRPVFEANPYGPEPTPTYPGFWSDGMARWLQLERLIPFDGPVRLIHGQDDPDVDWNVSVRLAAALRSDDVQVVLIKDGDHRLSRGSDIALLLRTIAELSRAG